MQKTVMIFMIWKTPARGALAPESLETHTTVIICMVFEMSGKGAAGFRIKRNPKNCHYFHVNGSGREDGDQFQNHGACIGLSAFSWFWKWARRKRLASQS